jgi:hypothetical protein
MARTFIGGLVAGIILFVVGFIFWATPLGELAYSNLDHPQSAAVHTALAQNITESGTGTYTIPSTNTREGAALYTQGPVATVHFNSKGFSPDDMSMILPGFVMAVASGLLIAFALAAVGGGGRSFGSLARLIVPFSIGITLWTILAQPVFNHFGWGYWIYSFIAETTGIVVAALVVARWFLPHHVGGRASQGGDGAQG